MKFTKKALIIALGFLATGSAAYFLFGLIRTDACLDQGGCWDDFAGLCRVSEPNAQALCDRSGTLKKNSIPIIGSWSWTKNGCVETQTYDEHGGLRVISGDEITEQRFRFDPAHGSNSRHKLIATVIKDHGGKDCLNSTRDNTNDSSITYVRFGTDLKSMSICFREDGTQCIGPYSRVSE